MKFRVGDLVVFKDRPFSLLIETSYKVVMILKHPSYCYDLSDIGVEVMTDDLLRLRADRLINDIRDNKEKEDVYILRENFGFQHYDVAVESELRSLNEAIAKKQKEVTDSCGGGVTLELNFSHEDEEDSVAPVKTTREQCLDDAKKCVCGDRDKQYGSPEYNFDIISDYWTTYLHERLFSPKKALEPVDVANMMCLFKLGRITTSESGGTYDSYVDLAGYAACGAEMNKEGK